MSYPNWLTNWLISFISVLLGAMAPYQSWPFTQQPNLRTGAGEVLAEEREYKLFRADGALRHIKALVIRWRLWI